MEISIDIKVQPVAQAYRQIAVALEQKVEQKLDDWLELDIVEMVQSSSWVSPLVAVPKENGEIRLCVDMRRANKAVLRERFVMPTLESLLPLLHGSEFFAKLDIKEAFHQLELAEGCRYITTFITRRGLMRFKRLMFGICCAPEIFQKTIHKILLGLKGTFNYLDDIIIFGKTKEELEGNRDKVLERLQNHEIMLNKEKCIMEAESLNFLGHNISGKGIKPAESKLKAIKDFRAPKTKEEVTN